MNFSAWTSKNSVPPNMRSFLCYAVPATANAIWSQPPLETHDEARDRMAEETEGDLHEDSELAVARSQQFAESATKTRPPVSNDGPPANGNDTRKRPPPTAAGDGNSRVDRGDAQGSGQMEYEPDKRARNDNNNVVNIDDEDDMGQRKLPARTIQRPRAEQGHNRGASYYDVVQSPPHTRRQRDPRLYQARGGSEAGYSPYREGAYGAARSPARSGTDWMQINERHQYNRQQHYDAQPPAPSRTQYANVRTAGGYGNTMGYEQATSRRGYELYEVAAAVAATTTMPEQWELLKPKKGQPESFGFLSAIFFQRCPEFQGCFVDARGQIGRMLVQHECNFPANVGTSLRKDFLQVKEATMAALWIASEAHSCQAYARGTRELSGFHPYTPWLSFDRFPATTVEAFRCGNWRCSTNTSREGPSTKYFSAFSILTLLEDSGGLPLLPSGGLSFKTGMKTIECLFWLMGLTPLSKVDERRGGNPSLVVESTPLLRTMHQFISILRRNEDDAYNSVASVWESDPPYSQLSVTYTILRDFDELFDLFLRLVKPPGSPSPYMKVCEQWQAGDFGQDEAAVTSLFTAAASPLDQNGMDTEVNIFAALQTWMSEKQTYYNRQLPRVHASQLLAVPANFVNGKLARVPAAQLVQQNNRDPTDNNDGLRNGKTRKTPGKNNANEQEVSVVPAKAVKPLLQWGPLATPTVTGDGPMSVCRDVRPKSTVPNVKNNNKEQLVCIQFTMAGVHSCKKGAICRFAHLDGQGASKDSKKYESLVKMLDAPTLKGVIVFTDEGKRVSGTN